MECKRRVMKQVEKQAMSNEPDSGGDGGKFTALPFWVSSLYQAHTHMHVRNTNMHSFPNLQDLFVRLSDGVLQGRIPLASLLHPSLGVFHLLSQFLQPPPGSCKLPLILLNLALLVHLLGLERQDLEQRKGASYNVTQPVSWLLS